jgi:hypothetical protein
MIFFINSNRDKIGNNYMLVHGSLMDMMSTTLKCIIHVIEMRYRRICGCTFHLKLPGSTLLNN